MKRLLCLLLCAALLGTCSLGVLAVGQQVNFSEEGSADSVTVYESAPDTQPVYAQTPDTQPSAADFTDVPAGAWYYEALDALVAQGGINGMTPTTFCPDDTITVEQFIKILVGCTLPVETIDAYGDGSDSWSAKYINAAAALGALTGFDTTPTHLAQPITRYEAAWLLVAFAAVRGEALAVPEGIERAMTDYQTVPETLKTAVGLAYGAGLMTGYPDGSFGGSGNLRRCEAAVTIVRLLDDAQRATVTIPEKAQGYDYTSPVPLAAEAVDDSWFSDAVFLGNSLCDGFGLYSGITQGTLLGKTSVTVFDVLSGSRLATLQSRSFGKIYLMLGVNEIGQGTQAVAEQYGKVLDQLKALQPGAQIYVQGVLPVCESMLTASQRSYHITNAYIQELNAALLALCSEKEVYYVNLPEAFADSTGALPASKSWDGVHLQAGPYGDWLNYLKTHTVQN